MSVIAGTTGATSTPTGIPASDRRLTVARRAWGAAARGSIFADRRLSSVVIDRYTVTRPSRAIGASRSRSRNTIAPLVTMLHGWRHSASTSSSWRVTPHSRSIGW